MTENIDTSVPETDSSYDTDGSTAYTETIRSSLLQSVRENGRKYHRYRDGHYVLPDDEQEQDRLDMQHEMMLRTFDRKLVLSPLPEKIENVLDLGTGTGIWCIEFADENPECQVLGTDLSPIQPGYVPPNCKFEVDDFESAWTFQQKFDFIHGRALLTSWSDGKKLVQQAYDALKPGGWLEFKDLLMPLKSDDGSLDGTTLQRWDELFRKAMKVIGRDPAAGENYDKWMEEVGFVNIVRKDLMWPQNEWPEDPKLKDLGKWNHVNTLDGLHGFTARPFMQILGMPEEEVQVIMAKCRADIKNTKIKAYWPIIAVYGQKPIAP